MHPRPVACGLAGGVPEVCDVHLHQWVPISCSSATRADCEARESHEGRRPVVRPWRDRGNDSAGPDRRHVGRRGCTRLRYRDLWRHSAGGIGGRGWHQGHRLCSPAGAPPYRGGRVHCLACCPDAHGRQRLRPLPGRRRSPAEPHQEASRRDLRLCEALHGEAEGCGASPGGRACHGPLAPRGAGGVRFRERDEDREVGSGARVAGQGEPA
mmetsp:Transcript_72466/g.183443  ORF Transcript_72466/g.183443 Transcript_72466/m.183443 type:complete len:211 (+) Transcript_72466:429-1061(+)